MTGRRSSPTTHPYMPLAGSSQSATSPSHTPTHRHTYIGYDSFQDAINKSVSQEYSTTKKLSTHCLLNFPFILMLFTNYLFFFRAFLPSTSLRISVSVRQIDDNLSQSQSLKPTTTVMKDCVLSQPLLTMAFGLLPVRLGNVNTDLMQISVLTQNE